MSVESDIKNGNIANLYLFYGKEAYKKRNYRELLKKYVLGDSPSINFNYFDGKDINHDDIYDISVTLPFFADRRLIIVENSGLFSASKKNAVSSSSEDEKHGIIDKVIDELPVSTCLVFIEESVSKNKKIFKKIASKGVILECSPDKEREIKLWLAKGFKKAGKKIKESTLNLLIEMVGTDYDRLRSEYEKIIAYANDEDVISDNDLFAVVSCEVESKIFSLIDAMAEKRTGKLLSEYYKLLSNDESPLYILAMIRRQFNIMLEVYELTKCGMNVRDVSIKLKMKEYPVKKALSYLRFLGPGDIERSMNLIADTEYGIKSGDLDERIGIEILLLGFASREENYGKEKNQS